ncbi:hypothetical protein [Mycobacterium dioxanotrophicus]|uniref:hypothetical protein n=1 Tax=Mycobacterium dioxanotrophicus TaxID=482462 RepID=UPI001E52DB6A|nr:hypothetical protein [Mycobacterium dioxanotrophicus]
MTAPIAVDEQATYQDRETQTPATSNTADKHRKILDEARNEVTRIRYAVDVLGGAQPAEVVTWLGQHGHTVALRRVAPEVKAYRDAHDSNVVAAGVGNESASTAFPFEPRDAPAANLASVYRPAIDTSQASTPGHPGDTVHALPERRTPWVAFACYAVAAVSMTVSLNTSWRFFDVVLHIPTANGERWVMFAVAELALFVCGAGMAVNVHRTGHPGAFRTIVWAMCAAMAYMAWAMSSPGEALGRILLGPVLGTVMLHLGLGLELRTHHQDAGIAARIGRELRERFLGRLGLGDDGRDAAQRTRDRKAYRAATLSRPHRHPWSRAAKLERALVASGVADDESLRHRMLARLAVLQHAHELATLAQSSPWHSSTPRSATERPTTMA